MGAEEVYDLCLPVLEDKELEDEEKTEKLEELLREKTSLRGAPLENAVLDALHRYRNAGRADASSPPYRHTVIRRASPASWQIPRVATPLTSPLTGTSPSVPPGFASRPSFTRAKSSTASPFTSPRPSPRLALAQPIPHSPSLQAYEFSDASPAPDIYGDYGSDTVDWLVNDDAASNASSTGGLSAAAPEWMPQPEMDPYDILRAVLGERKTNEEIEEALEANAYDLSTTLASLTESDTLDQQMLQAQLQSESSVLVGKSMNMEQTRPATPNSSRTPIVCKYLLQTGQCLRADCRFSHDLSNHICKYV